MLYKVPITYVVHMFLDYNYNSSMVQVHKLHKFKSPLLRYILEMVVSTDLYST